MMNWMKENYFITLFLGLSVMFFATFILLNTISTEEDYHIKIEQGDSLWELANTFASEQPKEVWIQKVMAMNNLSTSHIKAGDTIVIPKHKENYIFDHSTEIAGDSK